MKVDFFIIGPPRCASTSLAHYLSTHPAVCFAKPKEPTFFCTDISTGYENEAHNVEEYHNNFFSHYSPERHKIVGEGTPLYLMSKCAVGNILEYNPDAKFIALVRNPIEIITSMHAARVRVGLNHENITNFEDAWNAQEDRKKGKNLPENVIRGAVLQYRELGSIGTQLERLFKKAPPHNVKIIIYDDLIQNMDKTKRTLNGFLGIGDVNACDIPHLEKNTEWRSDKIRCLYESLSNLTSRLPIKPKMGLLRALKRTALKPTRRKDLRPEFRSQLREEFTDEIQLLSKLLNRDFSHWQ